MRRPASPSESAASGSLTGPPYPIGLSGPETPLRQALFPEHRAGDLAKATAREGFDDRLTARPLVVPRDHDLPHQVRVRRLEPLVAAQRTRQPAHAALAAHAADLDRLGDRGHR